MEITKIRGISEKREQELNKLGIFDTADMIRHFPRSYIDLREKQALKYSYHNDMVLTNGRLISLPVKRYFKRLEMVKATCEQEGYVFNVVWFNQGYVASKLKVGEEYLFYGRVRKENGTCQLTNPSFELCEKAYRLNGIVPQYKITHNLNQKSVRDWIRLAVNVEKPKSIIPFQLQNKYGLGDLYSSYVEVHNPTSFSSLKKASERIAIEEYFALISAFKYIKGGRDQIRVNKYDATAEEVNAFIKSKFSFDFTSGQKTAVNEIYSDMTGQNVMNRLLQGDVGSGKTAVALVAIYMAVKSGKQAVMLAPTEVLAIQNYKIIRDKFSEYNVAILTGSQTAKEKREIKARIKSGEINIVVGTHAVIQKDVEFYNLSLCVCDEQQRFGVAQRSSLTQKGDSPDVLVMSATPIPRTLSLIFYGDLDITTITDKPKLRLPVQTNLVPSEKYNDMLVFIQNEVKLNRKVYFVAPKIEGDEEGEVISITELFEQLKSKMPTIKVGLLHGKMKDMEKTEIMNSFKGDGIDVLVSTTVIEVGVDVPNASVMVIYNAERFGLSQLHQLRGRVGRSDIKSYCFLIANNLSEQSEERLSVLVNNYDGFKICEYDYKMRGAGDFLGDRQSGKFMNDLGSLVYGTEAIFLAKKISDEAFESGILSEKIKQIALEKYQKLKDIILN